MAEALVITPVKDSVDTTLETIRSVYLSDIEVRHIIYNDFSTDETTRILTENKEKYGFELVNLKDVATTPSPNYRLVLNMARQRALEMDLPLIIVESDVEVRKDTLSTLIRLSRETKNCGMIGSVTTDVYGKINFPYLNFKHEKKPLADTNHSLSFCCTLLSPGLLKNFSFSELSEEKHWYDVFVSRKSKQLGFHNYLAMDLPVVHKPHSSRPWKQLKYTNPLKYYFLKFIKKRDRI
ncbi:MAG: glycosyltransferase family A protein [Prolixibacteraceae bacterium]|jgi:GT2 family glycosyltransferase|nr:glycosyltransferase family A protein [Prolixibacteraceae bacterium]